MKKVLTMAGFLAFFALLGVTEAKAQCNASDLADQCISQLSDGFTFVKSFPIDGEGGSKSKIEYSYVFAKGTEYTISICGNDGTPDGIVVNLYDSNRRPITSNAANGKILKGVRYNCNSTGIYYITFTFDETSAKNCGGSVLGFKR